MAVAVRVWPRGRRPPVILAQWAGLEGDHGPGRRYRGRDGRIRQERDRQVEHPGVRRASAPTVPDRPPVTEDQLVRNGDGGPPVGDAHGRSNWLVRPRCSSRLWTVMVLYAVDNGTPRYLTWATKGTAPRSV